jgi:hypothetical protein
MGIVLIMVIAGLGGITAFTLCMLNAGLRDGDRPGDARVTGWLARAGQPDARPVVMVRVPRRTARRRFRAARHEVVGVVTGGAQARFAVPVSAAARRYLLTVVIGQAGSRLRVFRLPVTENDREAEVILDLGHAPQPF